MKVGYHYVRPFDNKFPFKEGIRYVDLGDFCEQLDFYCKNYEVLKKADLLEVKKGNKYFPNDKVLLTFDDGLSDHYNFVFPELQKRGLTGVFFVPTKPYLYGKHIPTFGLHYLIGKHGWKEVYYKALDLIYNKYIDASDFSSSLFLKNFSGQRYAEIGTLKILINSKKYFLNDEIKDVFIAEILNKMLPNLGLFDVHMNLEQLQEISESECIIGSHGTSHNYMSDLSKIEQKIEIKESFEFFKSNKINTELKTFAFPYGKLDTLNVESLAILSEQEVDFGFIYEENRELPVEYQNFKNLLINRLNPDSKNYRSSSIF